MKKANNKKCVAVLSSAALGVLIASALTTNAHAAVNGYVAKDATDASKIINFDSDKLLADYTNNVLGKSSPMFDAYMKDALVAFQDSKTGLVKSDSVINAYTKALSANQAFDVDSYTESATGSDLATDVTVGYTANADGTLTAVDNSKSIKSVSAITATTNKGTAPTLPSTVQVTLGNGKTANAAITWSDAAKAAATYAKAGTVTVDGTLADYDNYKVSATVTVNDTLAVQSVSANNLNQIIVTFTQPVDETSAEIAANYSLGGVDLTANDKFDLSTDKKTLTINLDAPKAQYAVSTFKVKGNVVTGDNASVATIPTFSKDLTFSDTTVPTVKSATVTGNKQITVEFSETVNMSTIAANAGTMFKIDGQYLTNYGYTSPAVPVNLTATNKYANKVQLNFATALPAGDHTLTTLKAVSPNLIDAAGFSVAEQTTSFNVASVTTAPKVTSVTGEDNGTIYVTYDRTMGSSALTAGNYQMNGIALPNGGTFKEGTDSTVVKFTGITNIAKGANVLTVNKDTVTDAYGNKVDENNDTRVSFNATEDTTAPTVTSVTPLSNTKVRVKFSEPVNNAYATNLANYKLKDSTGSTIALTTTPTAVGVTPTDTYDITTPSLTASNYTLEIENIVDMAATPNAMADGYVATFSGTDNVAPTVTEAVQVDSTNVAVNFSEAMDASTITNSANYYYIDSAGTTRALPSGTTLTAGTDNKSVEITFPSSYLINGGGSTAEYNVIRIVTGNVKDVAGNILSNFSSTNTISATGRGTVKPTYVADTFNLTSSTGKVTAEFELDQAITSLNIGDFIVASQVPDSGYVSGKNIVLEFTTPSKMNAIKGAGTGATLATVATGSTNIYGTPIAAITTPISVYDDKIAPEVVSIAPEADTSKVDVVFSEPIDGSIAGLYKDDFTVESGGTLDDINSVTVAGNTVTLNLASPLTAAAKVKAASNVSIKDLATDGAKTANLYVPTADDKDGTKGTITLTNGNIAAAITAVGTAKTTDVQSIIRSATVTATDGTHCTVNIPSTSQGSTVDTLVGALAQTEANKITSVSVSGAPSIAVPKNADGSVNIDALKTSVATALGVDPSKALNDTTVKSALNGKTITVNGVAYTINL